MQLLDNIANGQTILTTTAAGRVQLTAEPAVTDAPVVFAFDVGRCYQSFCEHAGEPGGKMYTTQDLAAVSKTSRQAVQAMVADGRLTPVKHGRPGDKSSHRFSWATAFTHAVWGMARRHGVAVATAERVREFLQKRLETAENAVDGGAQTQGVGTKCSVS